MPSEKHIFTFLVTLLLISRLGSGGTLTPDQQEALDEKLSMGQQPADSSANSFSLSSLAAPGTGNGSVEQSAPFSLAAQPQTISASAKLTFGFNSNVLGTHSESHADSFFQDTSGTISLLALHNATFDRALGYARSMVVTYTVNSLTYDDQFSSSDKLAQTMDVLSQGRFFDNSLSLTLDVKYANTLAGEKEALQVPEANPTARYFIQPWLAGQLGYDYSELEFGSGQMGAARQSGDRHTLASTVLFFGSDQTRPLAGEDNPWFPGWFDDISLGYIYTFNRARGSDFGYQGNRVRIALDNIHFETFMPVTIYRAFIGTTATISYQRDWNAYDNANSQLSAGKRRHDAVDAFVLSIKHTFNKNLSLAVEYDLNDTVSNLVKRTSNGNIVMIGAVYKF